MSEEEKAHEDVPVKRPQRGNRWRRIILPALVLLVVSVRIGIRLRQQFHKNDALVTAVQNNDATGVIMMLRLGADPNSQEIYQTAPANPAEVLAWIIGTRHFTRHSTPILNAASSNGNMQIVGALLANGANIEGTDQNGWTALMYASGAGQSEVVRLLVQRHVTVNARTPTGATALTLARLNGRQETVQLLKEAGGRE